MIFLTGLIVGSFLNCLIYRLEKGKSPLSGRSYCPHCRHILTWQDLIPLVSFLLLGGKCRYCHQKISWQYPLVEIATALLFILIFNFFNTVPNFGIGASFSIFNSLNLIYYWIIASLLIVIFVYDLKHYIIPDKVIYPAIGATFLYQLFGVWNFGHSDLFRNWKLEIGNLEPLILAILSAIGAASFFLLIVLLSHEKWMGVGDIKLAFLMGLFLGFPNILVALFSSYFIGAIIGLSLILFGKKTFKSEIPFGPFLVAGTFMALFWGEKIVGWYLSLMT